MEKAKERNQLLFMCFVDFTKAFDMVRHNQLSLSMLDMGFPPHLSSVFSSGAYDSINRHRIMALYKFLT